MISWKIVFDLILLLYPYCASLARTRIVYSLRLFIQGSFALDSKTKEKK
jgi:hypothetical protein